MDPMQSYMKTLTPEQQERLRRNMGMKQPDHPASTPDVEVTEETVTQTKPGRGMWDKIRGALSFGDGGADDYASAGRSNPDAESRALPEFQRGSGKSIPKDNPMTREELSKFWDPVVDMSGGSTDSKDQRTTGKKGGGGGFKPPPPSDSKPQGGRMDFASMISGINDAGDAGKLPPDEQKMYDDYKKELQSRKGKFNMKPLAALLDSWYGGNLSSAAKTPESDDEIDDKVMTLDMKLAARRAQEQEAQKDRNLKTTGMIMKHANDRTLQKHEQQINEYKTKLLLAQIRGAQGGRGGKAQMSPKQMMLAGFLGNNKGTLAKAAEAHKDPKQKVGNPSVAIRYVTQLAEQIEEKEKVPFDEALEMAQNDFSQYGYRTEDEAAGKEPNEGLFDNLFD